MNLQRFAAVAGVIAIVALGAIYLAQRQGPSTALPSATPGAIATSSALPTGSAQPTVSPSPQGQYLSKRLGFALTLPPPWRKASCGNTDPGRVQLPFAELFTSAAALEQHTGHIGFGGSSDRVDVRLDPNPEGLTPTQLAQRRFSSSQISSVTFAGRSAVEVRGDASAFPGVLVYIFADGDRTYSVSALPKTTALPDIESMLAILRSFRLLSSAEAQALPDPTPIPAAATTQQALAARLKSALEQKDIVALESLLGPCVSQGVVPGGGAAEPRERFVAELRQQFAAGVTVTVDASAIQTDTRGNTYSYVWSKWNAFPPGGGAATPPSPEPRSYNVQLIFTQTAGGYYWSGTLLVHAF